MPMLHPIQVAARMSGLSTHVIRIWEHRYQAVSPARTTSRRRMYSDADIERLIALRAASKSGHGIGQIAKLSIGELHALALTAAHTGERAPRGAATDAADLLEGCLEAVRRLDGKALEDRLEQAVLKLGFQGALLHLVAPLSQALGDCWECGGITAAHEHFASGLLRDFVSRQVRPLPGGSAMPRLLAACPAGQIHEMGAIFVGALAANLGWEATHLGSGLPALEIAGAARVAAVRAVALSLVYPPADPQTAAEIGSLAKHLPEGTALIVGGRAAPSYLPAIQAAGGILLRDLAELGSVLEKLRGA